MARKSRTGKLHNEGHVKDILQPLGEDEGNHVAEMHRVGAGSSAGVKVEGFALLESVEDEVELAARTVGRVS